MKEKIVIIGAGFAGLKLARELTNENFKVVLIDKHNYHQFQPLMYQVATSRLEPSSIAFPLRKIFQHKRDIHIRLAEVLKIDPETRKIYTDRFVTNYDKLVIAVGATTNYYGNQNLEKYAMPMKSVQDSLALRNRILLTFERAVCLNSEDALPLLNFVVVGGGPTGVELAGALAEMRKYILPKDYPDYDFSRMKIYLFEGTDTTLGTMSANAQKYSKKYLEELGVIVKTNTIVKDYNGDVVTFNEGETIATKNLIWAAGIKGNIIPGIPAEVIVKGGRLKVDRYQGILGVKDIYAIGDIAYMETEKYPKGHPQLANVATSQAKVLAKNFIRQQKGQSLLPFEYKDKGSMATVGKRRAVVDLPAIKFQGWFAWLTWMTVHFWLILSVRSKMVIFINWMISYFSNDSTLRIILRANRSKTAETLPKKEMEEIDAI